MRRSVEIRLGVARWNGLPGEGGAKGSAGAYRASGGREADQRADRQHAGHPRSHRPEVAQPVCGVAHGPDPGRAAARAPASEVITSPPKSATTARPSGTALAGPPGASAVLPGLKQRGFTHPARRAVGDGAPGFRAFPSEVHPRTRTRRCRMHRTGNVPNHLPDAVRTLPGQGLHGIRMAETRARAGHSFESPTSSKRPSPRSATEARAPKAASPAGPCSR